VKGDLKDFKLRVKNYKLQKKVSYFLLILKEFDYVRWKWSCWSTEIDLKKNDVVLPFS